MALYNNQEEFPAIIDYCMEHTVEQDDLLYRLERETALKTLAPQMLCGHLVAQFIAMLVRLKSPQYCVEIGTFTGYSAIVIARALGKKGKLITYEINPELKYIQEKYITEAHLTEVIDARSTDALKDIPKLDDGIDMVFIDGEKSQYIEYYQAVKPKMKPGGLILADNTLWSGKVLKTQKDENTRRIDEFNKMIAADPDVKSVLLPLRDGLTMISLLNNE